MFERFTDRARRVVVLAQEEARLFNHDHIGTEHLLLGLLHDPDGVPGMALSSEGITLKAVRGQLHQVVGRRRRRRARRQKHLPFSARAKRALESASQQASQARRPVVDPEHLLLGLLAQHEGLAVSLLENLGADAYRLRAHTLELAGQQPPTPLSDQRGSTTVLRASAPLRGSDVRTGDEAVGHQPVWMTPPADQLPAVVAEGRILARSDLGAVVALSHVEVFREGCLLVLRVAARRAPGMPTGEWFQLHEKVIQPFQTSPPDRQRAEHDDQRLRCSVRFDDDRDASTTDAWQAIETARATQQQPPGPVLMPRGGGGGGFDIVALSWSLWLWPLPPPTPIELEIRWPALQIETTVTELDGAALASAASQSQLLWPDETS